MAATATQTTLLISRTLPSTPYSAQKARLYTWAVLTYHGLDSIAEDTETVASELAANAIRHANTPVFGLRVVYLNGFGAVAVIVTDSSPQPPVKRTPNGDAEHGRGLNIVEALSFHWGWQPLEPGKAVFAIIAAKADRG